MDPPEGLSRAGHSDRCGGSGGGRTDSELANSRTGLDGHLSGLPSSLPIARHRVATFEGRGENLSVDVGHGDRIIVLAAHHDAVPGSPGANDNAASVAVLLTLLERWMVREPTGVRVRLMFPACEELGYLGARVWVRDHGVSGIAGVLSLELPGVGDSLAVWDLLHELHVRRLGRVAQRVRDDALGAKAAPYLRNE